VVEQGGPGDNEMLVASAGMIWENQNLEQVWVIAPKAKSLTIRIFHAVIADIEKKGQKNQHFLPRIQNQCERGRHYEHHE
jgi:hypothetical protein